MSRLAAFAITLGIVLAAAPAPAASPNGQALAVSADSVLLLDADGKVLFAKNPGEDHAPASLTKLMTLYLAYEDLEAGKVEWDEPVAVSRRAAETARYRMGLRAGEVVPLSILLEGVAIASANDAAAAVAEHLAGNEEAFVHRMNNKAQLMGLAGTRFANPHGLPDPLQRTTAQDMATLIGHLVTDYPAVADHSRRQDLRVPGPRLRAAHPALRRPRRRAGAEDRIHQRGRLQPGHRGMAGRPALSPDRAGLADAQPVLPRRPQGPAVRLRRQRARHRRRPAAPARAAARAGARGARAPRSPRRARRRRGRGAESRPWPRPAPSCSTPTARCSTSTTVVEAGRAVTDDPVALSALWRQKQLEYTWLRSLMDRYVDFWEVTRAALSFALRRLALRPSPAQADALMEAYLTLGTFPEVPMALARLAPTPLGILSNGSPMMLEAARALGRARGRLPARPVRRRRRGSTSPHRASTSWVPARSISPRGRSCSCRPTRGTSPGAGAFGYRTCWCNRLGVPMEGLEVTPDVEVERLDQIPERVGL